MREPIAYSSDSKRLALFLLSKKPSAPKFIYLKTHMSVHILKFSITYAIVMEPNINIKHYILYLTNSIDNLLI